ncbi:hypothetical protein PGB90_010166 [Kerria lacca]
MDAYCRVEKEIWEIEQQAPASVLTHTVSKLEKITADLEKITTDITKNQNYSFNQAINKIYDIDDEYLNDIDNSIQSVMTELHVMNDPKLAMEHEEFIANLNRKALKCRHLYLLNRRKLDVEEEAAKLSEKVQNLQKLYEQQDTILNEIFDSSHSSKIEAELDRLRNYRDTLFSGELAWQDAIKLTQSATIFSQVGFSNWQTIFVTSNDECKFRLVTEVRNAIQESALLIQSAQSLLPTVQFPYCTQREIRALLQVIKYLYTDMQISERYEHAKEVYRSFQKRTAALSKWLKELMDTTIHKDMEEVDKKIAETFAKLNSERMIQIKKKVPNVSLANGMILTAESVESLHSLHQKNMSTK